MTSGCYQDTDGRWRNPSQMYRAQLAARDPNRWRTFGWMTTFLAAGTLWYWLDRDRNAVDWELSSWTQRFERYAYRYDSNEFHVNWLWHPLSGAGFYGLARANQMNVLESTAAATLTSFAWEFLLEFKERVSVNDTLVTPLAGISLGEYLSRLSRYLSTAPGGGGRRHKALRWSLGLPTSLHQAWDGESLPPADAPATDAGWSTQMWADFVVGLSSAWARGGDESFPLYEGLLESSVVAIPGYLRPGDFRFGFWDANISSLHLRLGGANGRSAEVESEAVLAGVYRQRIEGVPGNLWGHAWMLGTSVNYLYRRLEFDAFEDHFSTAGLPGLVAQGHWLRGPLTLLASVGLHGEFAGVGTPVYQRWQEDNPDLRTKVSLEDQSYYYGWGGAGRARVEARLPWLRLGASILLGTYHSREGLDRRQRQLDVDFPLRDRQMKTHAWLRFIIPEPGVFFGLSSHLLLRDSRIDGYRDYWRLDRYALSVGLVR